MSASSPLTVALVHGAFADSSSWAGVVTELQRNGVAVQAISNPLRGLSADGDYVASALGQIEGDVVLVGHSYGGAVITYAGARAEKVRGLVYVAAFAPDAGQPVGALIAAFPETLLATSLAPHTYPTADGPAPEVYVDPAKFPEVFAADLPAEQTAILAASQRPIAAGAFAEPLAGEPAWKTLPSWFVVATADNAINPDSERADAAKMGANVTEVDASHAVAVSRPLDVAAVILDAVTTIAAAV